MTKTISFDRAISRAIEGGGKRHVLLGNGFSIGAHEKFGYESLYEEARNGFPSRISGLFDRYGTSNFEEVLRQLDDAEWLTRHYKIGTRESRGRLTNDYATVRDALTDAISRSHPDLPTDVGDDALDACADFLTHFENVFTLNYDLLLYWASLKRDPFPFQDAFGRESDTDESYCVFLPSSSPAKHIYFLHGALHLTTVDGDVRKFVWNTTHVPLIDQIRASIEGKQYPLVVSEGKATDKVKRIEGSSYLSWALRRFENIQGSLFTLGWSLAASDRHIREAIAKNTTLPRLFVGVYGNPRSAANKRVISDAEGIVKMRNDILASGRTGRRLKRVPLTVEFFDAASANIWEAA